MGGKREKLGIVFIIFVLFASMVGAVRSADTQISSVKGLDDVGDRPIEEVAIIMDSEKLDKENYVFYDIGQSMDNTEIDYTESGDSDNILFDIGQSMDNGELDYVGSDDGDSILLNLDLINSEEIFELDLLKGKNEGIIIPEELVGIRASMLVKLYPELATLSYYDEISKERKSYANVFGGVGEDFYVRDGEFEIFVNSDIKLLLS